jgi:hypothetical protein
MESFLDKRLGILTQRGTIVGLKIGLRKDQHGDNRKKLFLRVDIGINDTYLIDEAWVRDRQGVQIVTGLWFKVDVNGDVLSDSTPGKLMRFLKVETVRELIGKEVQLHPKPNHFLAVVVTEEFNSNAAQSGKTP